MWQTVRSITFAPHKKPAASCCVCRTLPAPAAPAVTSSARVCHYSFGSQIVLVRHGETQWNVEQRLQGQLVPGPGLTERGRQQAAVLASRLLRERFDSIYSSDLRRATETADIVVKALQGSGSYSSCVGVGHRCGCSKGASDEGPSPSIVDGEGSSGGKQQVATAEPAATMPVVSARVDPRLRERHLGVLQGLTRAEAAELQPAAYRALSEPVSPDSTVSSAAWEAGCLSPLLLLSLAVAAHLLPALALLQQRGPRRGAPWHARRAACPPPTYSPGQAKRASALAKQLPHPASHRAHPHPAPCREVWRRRASWRPGRSGRWRTSQRGTRGSACWSSPTAASCRQPTGDASACWRLAGVAPQRRMPSPACAVPTCQRLHWMARPAGAWPQHA